MPGRGNARSSRPRPPSSRPARGPGAGCWSCTRCPPTGCTSPSPASTPPTSPPGPPAGGALLCVAAVTFDKGHDVLLDALATISDLSWHCVCVGSLDRDPAFVESLRRRSLRRRAGRSRVPSRDHGPDADLDRSYAAADLMVLASRAETYGMVVTEALARGAAGRRRRRRRADGGPRSRRRRDPARAARPAGRPCGARRRAPGLARRRGAAERGCAGPRCERRESLPAGRPRRPSSRRSWPEASR